MIHIHINPDINLPEGVYHFIHSSPFYTGLGYMISHLIYIQYTFRNKYISYPYRTPNKISVYAHYSLYAYTSIYITIYRTISPWLRNPLYRYKAEAFIPYLSTYTHSRKFPYKYTYVY